MTYSCLQNSYIFALSAHWWKETVKSFRHECNFWQSERSDVAFTVFSEEIAEMWRPAEDALVLLPTFSIFHFLHSSQVLLNSLQNLSFPGVFSFFPVMLPIVFIYFLLLLLFRSCSNDSVLGRGKLLSFLPCTCFPVCPDYLFRFFEPVATFPISKVMAVVLSKMRNNYAVPSWRSLICAFVLPLVDRTVVAMSVCILLAYHCSLMSILKAWSIYGTEESNGTICLVWQHWKCKASIVETTNLCFHFDFHQFH